ncbi:MAG: SRPBCC family protein [Acidobacteria bacterium]|nr:SRPBCC family protein [Acidobacteriota bacterium]
MKIEEVFVVKAPIQKVWDFLWNVEEMVQCVPGVEGAEMLDPDNYRVRLKVKVGFISASFAIHMKVTEKHPPRFLRSVCTGEEDRRLSTLKQNNVLELQPLADGSTQVTLKGEVSLFGKLGTLGDSVVRGKARKMMEEFSNNVRTKIEAS